MVLYGAQFVKASPNCCLFWDF